MSKQFLLLCSEEGMERLKNVFKEDTVEFLEVQGLNLNNENKVNILVTPVLPPVTAAYIPPALEKEEEVSNE